MQRRTRFWVIGGLVVLVLAVACWWRFGGDRAGTASFPAQTAANDEPRHEPVKELGALNYGQQTRFPSTNAQPQGTNTSHNTPLLAYRVKNTSKPLKELLYMDSAILLRNALFDAAEPAPLEIPPHLKAQGDPGSFVVQARGAVDTAFLARLRAAGASIVSYIPNNAYLVRGSEVAANQLRSTPEVLSILPWEPYFKLDLSLLARAVNEEPLPEGEQVSVVVFPGERQAGLNAFAALGGHVIGEDNSPFGHQIIIQPPADSLVALAQLPIVQSIEPYRRRQLANDLTRVRVGVATNTLASTPNYLNLTGTNVMVNINDSGVERTHPDLIGRVFGTAVTDFDGHGTHVAGTLASSGLTGPNGTNAPGSTNGASFRGIAHAANLYSLPIDLLIGPLISDAFLQQTMAKTNVLISNNSWGYPLAVYNQQAAIYDAAVRDALPGEIGARPLIFVFAAGNVNNFDYEGGAASSDQVNSPATAKNVITVGALENLRRVTNMFLLGGETNSHFYRETDSDTQVANYSARGNVGVGLEGDFGRFKPDVVAPGSWMVSCRATNWQDPTNLVSADPQRIVDEFIDRRSTNFYFRTIPDNAIALHIRVVRNPQSPTTMPTLNIFTNLGTPPPIDTAHYAGDNAVVVSNTTPGQMWFALRNTNSFGVHFDLVTIVISTNDYGQYFQELKVLNDRLKPHYRYESGTSMAAPVVSGVLALMQEFFEQRLQRTNSPALMKALLINGARSVPCTGCGYDLQVQKQVNHQGWGSIRLTNSVPRVLDTSRGDSNLWPILMFDQDPDTALATGEAHTYEIQLETRARFEPLMVTLVWTDPPGNPVSSTKLVNDLDLIVTNLITGDYFVGNHIPQGSDFNEPAYFGESNSPPFDVVNNVENVFIPAILAQRYSVTVRGRRVNVNALTDHTNGIRQDYALVISSGNSALTNTFTTASPLLVKGVDNNPSLQSLSNKVGKFNQRVGANSPLLGLISNNIPGPSHGNNNQWNFYVFNNTNASHSNVAFFTFLASDLAVPRVREADIDLYTSRQGGLTNLNPAVMSDPLTLRSLNRGGTELIIIPNATTGDYFVGVKSEDQQAASYAIFAVAQEKPFGQRDEDGNIQMEFIPAFADIPDGSPEAPGGVRFFCPIADPGNVRRIIITNSIDHELGGDLLGTLTTSGSFAGVAPVAVLNNHRSFFGPQTFIYDDSGEDDITFNNVVVSQNSDGPGTLRDFEGRPAGGLWQFAMVDNTPFHTGSVTRIVGRIEPQEDTNALNGILLTIGAGKWKFTSVDVPVGVTNMTVSVIHDNTPAPAPLDVYIRRNFRPNTNLFDKAGRVDAPGGSVSHSRSDLPSLQSGRYHIGLFNPNTFPVRIRLLIEFQYSLRPLETFTYFSTNTPAVILDDVTTNFVIGVTNARDVADVKVGVRMDHDRLSDVVLHLISPEGTRILLSENRGQMTATNYGAGLPEEFVIPFNAAGDENESRTNIDTGSRQGIVRISYNFFTARDQLRVYYEGNRIFDSGLINGQGTFSIPYGPGISEFVEIVMNEGGQAAGTLWEIEIAITGPWNYSIFTDKPTLGGPIKFAFPPFSRQPTNITVFSNSFEGEFEGIYLTNILPAVTVVDGWAVRSNYVGIFTDPTSNAPCTGTNFLALSHGMISRGITNLVPGHEYVFNFGHRKISSSPTQSIGVAVSTRATPFWNLSNSPPANSLPAVPVAKLRVCPAQDVTAISSNLVLFGATPYTAEGDPNVLNDVNNMHKYGLIGCWSSHPTVLDPSTRASAPFYIGGTVGGTNSLIAAPNEPGDYYLFLGVNDDDYTDNNGFFIVDLRWAQCQLASADYFLGSSPTRLQGAWRTNWATESLLFMANPTTTNVAFRPHHNTTILLDCVLIDEIIPSAHFLSEEPLVPLQGQAAYGEWKLEVTDNRVGPTIIGTNDPTLLSWSLSFVFADGPAPIPLINGIQHNGTIRGDAFHYFVVSVPPEVNDTLAQVSSTGVNGGVEMFYSPFGLPEGNIPPDPIPPVPENTLLNITSNSPPFAPLVPGRQYFLAVRNVAGGPTVNDYSIRVDFQNVPITPLTPGQPQTTTIAPLPGSFLQTRAESSLAVANMHYYSFDVGSSGDPAITNLSFELHSNTNSPFVHLVASRALPVFDLFPRPTHYEYHSTETAAPDHIIITSNSIPVKLAPGRWYLGVYNMGTNVAQYTIGASESSSRPPIFDLTYLDIGANSYALTNFSVPPRNMLNSFYHFITHEAQAAVLFEIFNVDPDVDLIVRRGDLPSRDLYDFSFLSPRGGPRNVGYEPIPIRSHGPSGTNVFVPTLGVSTNWYVSLVNRGFNTATGMLCVKVFTDINPIVGCVFNASFTAPITPGGPFDICWDSTPGTSYDVEFTADLLTWSKLYTNQVATGSPTCVGITNAPGGLQFYRIRAN